MSDPLAVWPLLRWDDAAGQIVEIPKGSRCVCCGQRHDPSAHWSKLSIDHIHRRSGDYRIQILCVRCNSRKGPRRYVSLGPDRCWYPGMPIGATAPKPPEGERRYA